MRYLTLAEALVIAKASRLELLDSALHAPQASFGGEDFYPTLLDKAALLVVRVARNHALPTPGPMRSQAPQLGMAM